MRKPYFKKSHKAWYVNLGGKPVRLGQIGTKPTPAGMS